MHFKKYYKYYLIGILAIYAIWRLIAVFPFNFMFGGTHNQLTSESGNKASKTASIEQKKKTLEAVISKDPPNPGKLIRQDAYYRQVAEELYTKLNTYVFGISDNAILNTLAGKPIHNVAEIKLIAKYFGVRRATFFGVPVGDSMTLYEALKSKLTRWSDVDFYFKGTGLTANSIRY